MATREEIRKELCWIIGVPGEPSAITDNVLKYLHMEGVVLKVERELPEPPKEVNDLVEGWRPMALGELSCFKGATKWMLEAGYCAVEPLIEPPSDDLPFEDRPGITVMDKESEKPKCTACEGKGFIEYEHGLIQVECEDCKGTGIIEIKDGDSFTAIHTFAPEMEDGAEPTPPILIGKISKEEQNDSSSGTGQLDSTPRGEHPSKPKQRKKRKAKATARKRSS